MNSTAKTIRTFSTTGKKESCFMKHPNCDFFVSLTDKVKFSLFSNRLCFVIHFHLFSVALLSDQYRNFEPYCIFFFLLKANFLIKYIFRINLILIKKSESHKVSSSSFYLKTLDSVLSVFPCNFFSLVKNRYTPKRKLLTFIKIYMGPQNNF